MLKEIADTVIAIDVPESSEEIREFYRDFSQSKRYRRR
jgi:predicted phosphoribosyltransferase